MSRLAQLSSVFHSPQDRELILREADRDPAFGDRLEALLSSPDGERAVYESAMRAVSNEFDPTLFPESRGEWELLRAVATRIVDQMPAVIRSMPPGLGDLGQFEVIGQLVGSVVGAAANVYTAVNQKETAQKIQQMQLQAAQKAIQIQQETDKAQTAIYQSEHPILATLTQPLIAGLPLWLVVTLGYIMVKRAER